MNHFEWNWTQQGLKLYGQGWSPMEVKGVVCIVHGFNEHSSRYADAAERLTKHGYAVLAHDQFGHGKTEGKRGHTPGYDAFLDSVQIVLDEANKRFPEAKKYLWGHSMGGAIVVNFLLRRNPKINAAVATGPLFKLAFEPAAFKVMLASMMKNIYPAFTEKAELDSAGISRDAAEVQKYNADPFNHGKITAGTFFGFFEAGKWAIEHANDLKIPLLLMHGTADRLTSAEGTKEFAAKAPKNLVTLKLWDGYFHELHNEPEPDRTAAINFMINWLDKH